jgi:hypothetical protein
MTVEPGTNVVVDVLVILMLLSVTSIIVLGLSGNTVQCIRMYFQNLFNQKQPKRWTTGITQPGDWEKHINKPESPNVVQYSNDFTQSLTQTEAILLKTKESLDNLINIKARVQDEYSRLQYKIEQLNQSPTNGECTSLVAQTTKLTQYSTKGEP